MIINYSDQPVKKGLDSIFLAGPTPRDKSIPSWRPDAVEYLKRLGFDGIVYIPENSNGEPKFNYDDQVEWEWEALDYAGVILFWVPRNMKTMPALITNVEFGSYIKEKKGIYGRPNDAESIKYLDKFFKRYHIEDDIYENLEDLCAGAIELLKGMSYKEKMQAAQKAFWDRTIQNAMNQIKESVTSFIKTYDYVYKDINIRITVTTNHEQKSYNEYVIESAPVPEKKDIFTYACRLGVFIKLSGIDIFMDMICPQLEEEGFTITERHRATDLVSGSNSNSLVLLEAVLRL